MVGVGLTRRAEARVARSSPRFLPTSWSWLCCCWLLASRWRRLVPTGPRPPGPGGAPRWTNDLNPVGAVWWPLVCHRRAAGWASRSAGSRAS